jgi:erythronate-4-phosphate dehydrogenase
MEKKYRKQKSINFHKKKSGMLRIVADDKIPFLKGVLEPYAEMIYIPGNEINRESLLHTDAILIRTRTKCNESLLSGTGVRFIGTATIGFDHIDTNYCDKNGIIWTNARGCNSSSVQQYISAALLQIAYKNNYELKNKTLGIIGVGNVGSKVENFARAIGMNVILSDPPRERTEGKRNFKSLDKLLSESDIVTVHVPLNMTGEDYTFHLFNDAVFTKIKRGSWFINSSRGEVTDTRDLKKALNSGILGGAIIDVWENEPAIDTELMQMVLIGTPHIAGYSTDGKANGTAMVVDSISKYFNLPLVNWYPENIPPPDSPHISINCEAKSDEDIIREAVFHTYNIDQDDAKLRHSPADFEKFRGDYPLRREFPSYTIYLKGGFEKSQKILEDIGFQVKV